MQEIKRTNLIGSKLITAMLACIICVLVTSRVYAEDTVIATGDCSSGGSSVIYALYDTDGDEEADKIVISGEGAMAYYLVNSMPWYDYRTELKTAVIEEGVTNIGAYAFYDCSDLTSVTIPDSVTSIRYNAFDGCRALTSVTIPDSVTSIGAEAFRYCSALTSVTIPRSVERIEEGAFYACSALTSVVIEEGVKTINRLAFARCGLTSVTIPDSVTGIGDYAFGYEAYLAESKAVLYRKLDEFVINGYSGSKAETYANEEGFTFVDISSLDNHEHLINRGSCDDSAFYMIYDTDGDGEADKLVVSGKGYGYVSKLEDYRTTLKTVVIEEGITAIGGFSGCSALTSVTIPESVTEIGESAFSGCSALTSVAIPKSVTALRDYAFKDCSALTSITIPGSVKNLGGDAYNMYVFENCSALTSVIIEDGVQSIGNGAFKDCSKLTSVSIPESVTRISYEAFFGCSSLTSVSIPDSVEYISLYAFGYVNDSSTVDGFIIKGYSDSEAQRYANENGFTFIDISSPAYDNEGHLTDYSDNASGWQADSTGTEYWYENGYRMGYDAEDASYRGKEIYDPGTGAWFWLDNVDGGKKAVSKDVYQESKADDEGNIGKWVRYDANGYMIKGWDENENGKYFFDYTYGTMIKGYYTIDGTEYYFNTASGVLERTITDGLSGYTGWKNIDGADYWYEDGQRQGTKKDPSYRGKEIYDPDSDAWYWLDNVDGGKKAVSKDTYQESGAGDWGDIDNGDGTRSGKWVRYDSQGRMIKGWCAGYGADARAISSPSEANGEDVYYFDFIYGTMAKGQATIDGVTYTFAADTGVLVQ